VPFGAECKGKKLEHIMLQTRSRRRRRRRRRRKTVTVLRCQKSQTESRTYESNIKKMVLDT
jgi:hypothetical protein